MFIIFLRFSDNKANAAQYMSQHNDWIKLGIDERIFLLVGSLGDNRGGGILAHNTSLDELKQRLHKDPFISEKVVVPEIIEFTPGMAESRLSFLLD